MATILLIDDEEALCWSLRKAFQRQGHTVLVAASAEAALEMVSRQPAEVVILDVRLPGMDGLAALNELQVRLPGVPIIVITAHGNLSTAVRAVEGGAFDYLPKPFELSQIEELVARALALPQATTERTPPAVVDEGLIGQSPAMQGVFRRIALVAPQDACVLITGASGTGKELVARAIHRHSSRRERPFLPVHVAALNPNLVESELFGHARGAFTGAAQARPGLLTLADGGTVFLDELADIPLEVQAKLLRVLEYQEVLPVGASQAQSIDVRLLSATHQELDQAVHEGRFRHDLYYRLNVFNIHLPPLCERGDDTVLLAEYFLHQFRAHLPLPGATVAFLRSRPWTGNVRELRNALEHAAILARGGPVLPSHFPEPIQRSRTQDLEERIMQLIRDWTRQQLDQSGGDLYDRLLQCIEPALVEEVLTRLQGNRLAAAKELGVARATLRRMMRKHQGESSDAEDAS